MCNTNCIINKITFCFTDDYITLTTDNYSLNEFFLLLYLVNNYCLLMTMTVYFNDTESFILKHSEKAQWQMQMYEIK